MRGWMPGVLAVIFTMALAGCGGGSGGGGGGGNTPADLTISWQMGQTNLTHTIKAGQTVAWLSTDGLPHTVTSSATTAAFTEIAVAAGGTGAAKFATAGTFTYHCRIHGQASMNGTLTVTP